MKYKKTLVLIILLIFPSTLCSCKDKTELGDISAVLGIAVDKIQGDNPICLTAEVARPNKNKSESSSNTKPDSVLLQSTGKTIFDAIQNFTKISSTLMDYSHTNVIIISKNLCESTSSDIINFIRRNRQFRSEGWLLVSNKEAKKVLQTKMPNGSITSMDIDDMMTQYKKNGSIIPTDINTFIINSENESKISFAPLIDINVSEDSPKGKIIVENTAIFKNYKLIDIIKNDESKSLLWLNDKAKGHITVYPFKSDEENKNITVDVYKKSSKIVPYITNDGFKFKIVCKGYGIIRELQGLNINSEKAGMIENNVNKSLKEQFNEFIKMTQKNNIDMIGLSNKIYNNYPKEWLNIKENWSKIYPNVKCDVDVKIDITNIGTINNSI